MGVDPPMDLVTVIPVALGVPLTSLAAVDTAPSRGYD